MSLISHGAPHGRSWWAAGVLTAALACDGTTRAPDTLASTLPAVFNAASPAQPALPASAAAAAGAGVPRAGVAAPESADTPGTEVFERQGEYTLSWAGHTLTVDPMRGARIERFGRGDQNLLSGPEVDALHWGSTFWPSPQRTWDWPPVAELDSDPFLVMRDAAGFAFVSRPATRLGVSVQKRFHVREGAVLEVEYTLRNEGSLPASWAAWEVTRVAAGGLTFFPTGQLEVSTQLPVLQLGAATWYRHQPAQLSGAGQRFAGDGRDGWLAHVVGRTLFLKRWDDVPVSQQAPGPEAEIAINALPSYVELEEQGPYTPLLPGQQLTWSVRWSSCEIPATVPIEVGSTALFDFAASTALASPR